MSARLVPLLDFVPAVNPRFARPSHLSSVAELLERTEREPVRALISVPPRHGKTELLKACIARRLLARPETRVIYASYSARFAEKKSREARGLYSRAGGKLADDATGRRDWRTTDGEGGVWATSIDGPTTGEGGDLVIVDDPTKDRATAESAIERDHLWEWFGDTLYTRLEPNASLIVVSARWHPDDLIGRLLTQEAWRWERLTLPALDGDGRALWPERFNREQLLDIKEKLGEYGWASLYQGTPLPRGGALFQDAYYYDALPASYRIGKGCDLAYTAKTRADRSAAVVMLESDGHYYVVDVQTAQVQVPHFIEVMRSLDGTWPGAWHWYTSTTEMGLADLATASSGVHIQGERAAADKFTRAQPFSAAWNAGKVLLPRNAPWLEQYLSEILAFTGSGDRKDDQLDASVSAFARLGGTSMAQIIARERAYIASERALMQGGAGGAGGANAPKTIPIRGGFTDFAAMVGGTPRPAPEPTAFMQPRAGFTPGGFGPPVRVRGWNVRS